MKNTMTKEMLDQVSGGSIYDDPCYSAEDIIEAARDTARYWKDSGWDYNRALDLLPRYFSSPGKVTKEEIVPIVKEAFGAA